jgi:Na+-driven multidrug efflux pump
VVTEEYRGARQWSRNKQAVATVIWISFLTAAVATMLFFALFDPVELLAALDPELEIGRQAGYAAGFFFFWIISAGCSAVTAWLVRTAPKRDAKNR